MSGHSRGRTALESLQLPSTGLDARVLYQMVEFAPVAILALDREWRVAFINAEGARLVQRTAAELIGKNLWHEFPGAVGSVFEVAYRRAVAQQELVRVEDYFAPLDRWFEITAYPIDIGLAVQLTDVTQRRAQQVKLARGERELARAQEIARVGSWSWEIATDTVEWSEETYRLLAFEDDYRPRTARMDDFVHPDDVAANWAALTRTLETGAPYDIVLRMRPRDGSTRICHALAAIEHDAEGRVVRLFGTLQDITERVMLEQAAERDKRDLQQAFRIARMANYVWDLTKEAISWSPEYYDLLGLDPAEFNPIRANVLGLVHPDDLPGVRQASQAAFVSGAGFEMRYRMRHADGSWRHFTSIANIERDADGTMRRVVGCVRDRTDEMRIEEERRQLERQLQDAQKLESLGVLAGGIAHDFNNLLVGILGNVSLALVESPPNGANRSLLVDIEGAAQRASDLTRQLLAYAGKGRFVVEPVSMSQVVEEMLTLARSAMSRKAELHLDLARGLPSIAADATQVRQVVMNLLANASDALEDRPGSIVLRTGLQEVDATYRASMLGGEPLNDGAYVFLEVCDTGVGMDAETVGRIFDPFFTTKFTGRGLGLAAARGIVQGHQGAIRVYSEPGKGTTFKLFFPASDQPVAERRSSTPVTGWRGAGTVLVIDDEPAVRRVTRSVLERRGFDVLEAADGIMGLEVYRQERERICLTLLDLTMPRMDGEETFRQLRMIDPTVRVLLMSGYNAQNVTTHFVGKGLAGFVQKPFRAEELEEQVRSVLEG